MSTITETTLVNDSDVDTKKESPVVEPEITPEVLDEVNNEPQVGKYIGQCKWWSDKLGYGFVTIQQGDLKGKDIFLHHSGIRPLNSNYRTLKKGEYINFDVIEGSNGLQATNVTGIGGGTLICDVNPIKPISRIPLQPPPPAAAQLPYEVPHREVPYAYAPPPHTIASAAYITHHPGRGSYTPGRGGARAAPGRGSKTGLPFSHTAPNRPYYRPRSTQPPNTPTTTDLPAN